MPPETRELASGIRAAVLAYVAWGLLTIYWKQLNGFSAFELISWRIVAASIVMAVVVTVRRRWAAIRMVFGKRGLVVRIAATALLLTANWTAYVYAVVHDRVIETALGYFMAPLGTMILGIAVLKERPTTAQKVAIGFAAAAVVQLTVSYGELPVAGLTMALSWSVYGVLKRRFPLPAVDSFAAESFVLLVPAGIVMAAMSAAADSVPRTADALEFTLVSASGVATAVPLVLFAFAAIRVPLTILGPLQYLVPTIQFLLGWVHYGEELPWSRVVGFALVWTALAIITVDLLHGTRSRRAARFAAVSAD